MSNVRPSIWRKTLADFRARIHARTTEHFHILESCESCGDLAWIAIGDLALCCGCWETTPARLVSAKAQ